VTQANSGLLYPSRSDALRLAVINDKLQQHCGLPFSRRETTRERIFSHMTLTRWPDVRTWPENSEDVY